MKNKEVFRKCLACGQIKNREYLIKITKYYKNSEIFINPNSKIFGRSAYVCSNEECLKLFIKKKRFQRALKKELSEDIIKKIQENIK